MASEMEVIKPEQLLPLLDYLLPGFIAAGIFYALSAFRRPGTFERIVQALIFTAIVQFLVLGEHSLAVWLGSSRSLGTWSPIAANTLTAVALGVVCSYCVANDRIYALLRFTKVTEQRSYQTEWIGAFKQENGFIALELKDGRRLWGWPFEWPPSAKSGHFRILYPRWLRTTPQGKDHDLKHLHSILINVTDVRWVEFENPEGTGYDIAP